MGKYIPAVKLIAEIKRQIESAAQKADISYSVDDVENEKKYDDERNVLERLLELVTSLQQEQPSPHWIRANYSDKPEIRRSPSGDLYLQNGSYMIWLSDLDTLPKDGKDLNNPIQEQPEVELEKEAVKFVQSKEFIESKESPVLLTARHFAEWGAIHFNARREK